MASAKDVLIQQLHQVEKLLSALKKEENLTKDDLLIFSIAQKYFGEKYFFKNNYSKFLKNLPISAVTDYINALEKKDAERETQQKKPKEQETSIPPELESLVAEYRENQALLESEEIKASSQKSVAAQVKIAIAHRKIVNRVLANQDRRDTALVALGSPRSGSVTEALTDSYYVTKKIAFTYGGFSKLSPQLQNQIISSAVELNLVGVSDFNTAIQASALQVNISSLSDSDKNNLATIPGGFVSTIYQEVVALGKQEIEYQSQISANEEKIADLEGQGKIKEAQLLAEENLHLLASIEGQSARFADKAIKLTESFKDFEKTKNAKYSQIEETDRDFKDKITSANGTITSIHNSLERNGVKGHLYSPMDEAYLLEQAIRRDMPGALRSNAGYEAEYAAALISHPKTQDPNLSPLAVLLYGKELTPTLLAKARRFAKANPDSAIGKLFQTRKDIFDATATQIGKISQSPLGKEILKTTGGLSKVLKSTSKFFDKISDKVGGFGTVFRVISNPWRTFRSWAGRKAGEYFIKKIVQYTGKEAAGLLLKNGIKGAVKKLVAEATAKAIAKGAAKLGIKLALEAGAQAANVIPGLGIVIAIAIDVLWWVGEKTIGFAKKVFDSVSVSLYGEKIKARDLLAIPAAGVATAVGGVVTFFGALGTATVAAASSAAAITATGIAIGVFFYITSIAVAPLLSTLVNLQSTPGLGKATGCANIEGTFVFQRDPAWANVLCPTCISGNCKIGSSGCGSAATTMILRSFGIDERVVDTWQSMHTNGGYAYTPLSPPYTDCSSYAAGNIKVLTDNDLFVTDIGYSLEEVDKVLNSCGLILARGMLFKDCPDQENGCGHYVVITGHEGNLITTNDPWSGEGYVHNIDGKNSDTFLITQMFGVVPNNKLKW